MEDFIVKRILGADFKLCTDPNKMQAISANGALVVEIALIENYQGDFFQIEFLKNGSRVDAASYSYGTEMFKLMENKLKEIRKKKTAHDLNEFIREFVPVDPVEARRKHLENSAE